MEAKEVLVPGTKVFDFAKRFEGVFVENDKTFTSVVSLRSEGKVIPLKGLYLPRFDDFVIGIVSEERFSGYVVDLNSPYGGVVSARDLRFELKAGDVVAARIVNVNEVNDAELKDVRKLSGGDLMEVEHVKVPRLIGKNNSMIAMLEQYTKCDIFIGKNGRVYLKGENVALASLTILKICREAHMSGLTDRIQAFLKEKTGLDFDGKSVEFKADLRDDNSL